MAEHTEPGADPVLAKRLPGRDVGEGLGEQRSAVLGRGVSARGPSKLGS